MYTIMFWHSFQVKEEKRECLKSSRQCSSVQIDFCSSYYCYIFFYIYYLCFRCSTYKKKAFYCFSYFFFFVMFVCMRVWIWLRKLQCNFQQRTFIMSNWCCIIIQVNFVYFFLFSECKFQTSGFCGFISFFLFILNKFFICTSAMCLVFEGPLMVTL